ncbi:uncharacterized protein LOC101848048 [Aplysia californica]|uniref:Uncharacterized protein LOC101848048 n=1 Tax=Aplysia californica TaxID=6500 RepID=A0ABM1A1F5_APLCA|nr:uncharacterized protein LOC101848048 [Aplysia californica]
MWSLVTTWLFVAAVTAYSDLRATPCMSDYLINKIPENRSVWSGEIQMVMECSRGYDLPLNAPPEGVFRCSPDRLPWKPSFIPDCNKEHVPRFLNLVLGLPMSVDRCEKVVSGRRSAPVSTNLGFLSNADDISSLCDDSGVLGGSCLVRNVTGFCSGPPRRASQDTDFWAQELGLGSSFLLIVLRTAYNTRVSLHKYMTAKDKVAKALRAKVGQQGGQTSDNIESLLKAECPKGSLGVERTESDKKIVCRGCSLGHRLDPRLKQCVPCPGGLYQDEPLSENCKVCPALFGMLNETLWAEIKIKVRGGVFSMTYCPSLEKREDGSVSLVMPRKKIGVLGEGNEESLSSLLEGSRTHGSGSSQLSLVSPVLVGSVVGVTLAALLTATAVTM